MNISHKHKTIWWAPERCGTKGTAHIFNHFDFDYIPKGTEKYGGINKQTQYQSHEIIPPPSKYEDYNVICSIRNPYDRMLGVFVNFVGVGKSCSYLKSQHNIMVNIFSTFIDELFKHKDIIPKFGIEQRRYTKILDVNVSTLIYPKLLDSYVSKYNFDVTIPNNYIRMEHSVEDLGKIDFINRSPLWSSGYIKNYLTTNQYINTRPYQFNSMYTLETAKKVYEYHKQFFLTLGYDPFSFTTEELSDEEKMRFLHEII
jgi:hypothetical protein